MTEPAGRRERKKARTRKTLADAALRLFLERGYDQVGVKEVAEAADVSVSTLFAYFPTKEALVFDRADDIEADLVAAVRDRAEDESIPGALRRYALEHAREVSDAPDAEAFLRMIEETPALRAHGRSMWLRHESALAGAITAEIGAPEGDVVCAAFARFALEAVHLIHNHPNPEAAAEAVFGLLEDGWTTRGPGRVADGRGRVRVVYQPFGD